MPQVYGKYNTTAYDKLKMDLMYIENYSLLMDLKLLFMTVKVMFMKESTEGLSKEQLDELISKETREMMKFLCFFLPMEEKK